MNTVFQKYALFTHLNVFDNIAFGLKLRKLPKAEIAERVERMLRLVKTASFNTDTLSISFGFNMAGSPSTPSINTSALPPAPIDVTPQMCIRDRDMVGDDFSSVPSWSEAIAFPVAGSSFTKEPFSVSL